MKKILSFEKIDRLAKVIAKYSKNGDVIALIGDLGTGKTTFTKTFAKELGINQPIKSPTFNYVLEYFDGRLPLYHFDVYRLESSEEIYEIGYEDYLQKDGVVLIEWANIIEDELPKKYLKIELGHYDENSRVVVISYIGDLEREEELIRLLEKEGIF